MIKRLKTYTKCVVIHMSNVQLGINGCQKVVKQQGVTS